MRQESDRQERENNREVMLKNAEGRHRSVRMSVYNLVRWEPWNVMYLENETLVPFLISCPRHVQIDQQSLYEQERNQQFMVKTFERQKLLDPWEGTSGMQVQIQLIAG